MNKTNRQPSEAEKQHTLNVVRLTSLYQPLMDEFMDKTNKLDLETAEDLGVMLEYYSQVFGVFALQQGTIRWREFNIPWMIERVIEIQTSLTHFLKVAEKNKLQQFSYWIGKGAMDKNFNWITDDDNETIKGNDNE